MRAYILPTERGFATPEFCRLRDCDPLGDTDRYQDICGRDIGEVLYWLDWSFVGEPPVTVSLTSEIGDPLATGFAAPIRLRQQKIKDGWHGINLSYAVNSQYEGHGFGLAVSCLAILEAEHKWGELASKNAFLNIQTRKQNERSNSLIERITGHAGFERADFVAKLSNLTQIEFSGARIPWKDAVRNAERHLLAMPFLAEMQTQFSRDPEEETIETFSDFPAG